MDNNNFDFSNTTDFNNFQISPLPHGDNLHSAPQTMTVSVNTSDVLHQSISEYSNSNSEQHNIHDINSFNQGVEFNSNTQPDFIHKLENNHSVMMNHEPQPIHFNDEQQTSTSHEHIYNQSNTQYLNQFNSLDNSNNNFDSFNQSQINFSPIHSDNQQLDYSNYSNYSGIDNQYHQYFHQINPDNRTLHFESHLMVMNSSSHHCLYTTISDSGQVYKHTSDNPNDSYYVGYISNGSIYNSSGYYQGYGGANGRIYDHLNHFVGSVDGCGNVCNTAGIKVYQTTKGVAGAAAYLLLVYHGGVS